MPLSLTTDSHHTAEWGTMINEHDFLRAGKCQLSIHMIDRLFVLFDMQTKIFKHIHENTTHVRSLADWTQNPNWFVTWTKVNSFGIRTRESEYEYDMNPNANAVQVGRCDFFRNKSVKFAQISRIVQKFSTTIPIQVGLKL